MQDNDCPYCAVEILEAAFLCKHCGRDLHAMRIAKLKAGTASKTEQYQVVPDGTDFGIAFQGEVILHGMDMERAQSTVQILNQVLKEEKAG